MVTSTEDRHLPACKHYRRFERGIASFSHDLALRFDALDWDAAFYGLDTYHTVLDFLSLWR